MGRYRGSRYLLSIHLEAPTATELRDLLRQEGAVPSDEVAGLDDCDIYVTHLATTQLSTGGPALSAGGPLSRGAQMQLSLGGRAAGASGGGGGGGGGGAGSGAGTLSAGPTAAHGPRSGIIASPRPAVSDPMLRRALHVRRISCVPAHALAQQLRQRGTMRAVRQARTTATSAPVALAASRAGSAGSMHALLPPQPLQPHPSQHHAAAGVTGAPGVPGARSGPSELLRTESTVTTATAAAPQPRAPARASPRPPGRAGGAEAGKAQTQRAWPAAAGGEAAVAEGTARACHPLASHTQPTRAPAAPPRPGAENQPTEPRGPAAARCAPEECVAASLPTGAHGQPASGRAEVVRAAGVEGRRAEHGAAAVSRRAVEKGEARPQRRSLPRAAAAAAGAAAEHAGGAHAGASDGAHAPPPPHCAAPRAIDTMAARGAAAAALSAAHPAGAQLDTTRAPARGAAGAPTGAAAATRAPSAEPEASLGCVLVVDLAGRYKAARCLVDAHTVKRMCLSRRQHVPGRQQAKRAAEGAAGGRAPRVADGGGGGRVAARAGGAAAGGAAAAAGHAPSRAQPAVSGAAPAPVMPAADKKPPSKRARCDCCDAHYDDLEVHLTSEAHVRVVSAPGFYAGLDAFAHTLRATKLARREEQDASSETALHRAARHAGAGAGAGLGPQADAITLTGV